MTRLQVRRGSAAAWTASNTLLSGGEFGYEIDTKKLKIGDGATEWISLPYFESSALSGSSIVSLINASASLIDDDNIASTISRTSHTHGNVTNTGYIGSAANLPIITGTSGILQAGSFGTGANTFCVGNDSRLSNARTPVAHVHGNITNAGAIGTTADLPIKTTTSGVLVAGAFGTGATDFAAGNHAHSGVYEPIISTKNSAFNVNFGTAAGTACVGNDSRLSDARTPTSHAHGSITNTGYLGVTANLPLITGTSGIIQAGSFGTGANTFCAGNDGRLSDARTPTSHTHGSITNAGAIGTTSGLPIITTTAGALSAGLFGTTSGTFCAGNDTRITANSTATSSVTGQDLRSIPGSYYVVNSYTASSMSTAAIVANYMVYVPLIIGNKDLHISAFALNIQTGATGNFVVGIYSNDDDYNSQSGFCPDTLLTYSTAASTSDTGVIDSACDYTFTKNKVYWIGWMASSTPTCYYKTQAYLTYLGQLPASPTSSQTCWRHSQTYNATPPSVGTLVAHDTAGYLHYKVYTSA